MAVFIGCKGSAFREEGKMCVVFYTLRRGGRGLFSFSPAAEARDDIFRIEIGKSSGGSDRDLRERVWMLERAVDQLQRKVF